MAFSFREKISFTLLFWLLCGFGEFKCAAADLTGLTDNEIRAVVLRVAKHQLHPLADGDYINLQSVHEAEAAKSPEGIAWNYPWGVTLFGILHALEAVDDPALGKFVGEHNLICSRYYGWLAGLSARITNSAELTTFTRNSKIKGLMTLGNLDNCGAMGNEMLECMIRFPEQTTSDEKKVVARIADWVVDKQDRLPDGTLWRPKAMGATLWPDDLYMGGVFLVRWGIYNHDQKFIEDAASNIIHQAALEADADGLWFHGYFVNEKKHGPFKWGRGNGWVTVALVETLSALDEKSPLRPKLIAIFKNQIEGLKKVQAADGMWRQVLDKPELWEETSCTAMFTYGIARAVNRGWIDAANMEVARRAFAGIAKNVTTDGRVKGTCQGTNIGTDLDYYVNRPRPDNDLHGRGPVLLAGVEILMAGQK